MATVLYQSNMGINGVFTRLDVKFQWNVQLHFSSCGFSSLDLEWLCCNAEGTHCTSAWGLGNTALPACQLFASFFRTAAHHGCEYSKRNIFFPLFPTALLHLMFFCNTFRRLRACTCVCYIPPTNSLLTAC